MSSLLSRVARGRSSSASSSVVLGGVLDSSSAPMLAATIAELCVSGAAEISLDLTHLQTIDAGGVGAIGAARRVCERHRCELVLAAGESRLDYRFSRAPAPRRARGAPSTDCAARGLRVLAAGGR